MGNLPIPLIIPLLQPTIIVRDNLTINENIPDVLNLDLSPPVVILPELVLIPSSPVDWADVFRNIPPPCNLPQFIRLKRKRSSSCQF